MDIHEKQRLREFRESTLADVAMLIGAGIASLEGTSTEDNNDDLGFTT
jgi:hypothetical protein